MFLFSPQMCYTVTTLKPMNETSSDDVNDDDDDDDDNDDKEEKGADDPKVKAEDKGWISKGCARRVPLLSQKTECLGGGKCEYACYKSDCNYMSHSAVRGEDLTDVSLIKSMKNYKEHMQRPVKSYSDSHVIDLSDQIFCLF